jgi:putative ABC transport system permease protein
MTLVRLACRNLAGNAFRSWTVFLCALVVASLTLSATLILRGAESSLRLALRRLGADIVVVPQGAEAKVETALLMGTPATAWMPAGNLRALANTPGVAAASPQMYLASLSNASCCSASEMFVVALDPRTDFTITPWLKQRLGDGLRLGEAVGGSLVFIPPGERYIKLYGYHITLKGNLEPTGTGLDQTMFLTFETAQAVAKGSLTLAEKPLTIPSDSVSAILVNVVPDADPRLVARRIKQELTGVSAIPGPDLFQSFRRQMTGVLRGVVVLLGMIWALSVGLVALVFSMAANERRREIGVLRALGSPRGFVLRSLLAEAAILGLGGGAIGLAVSVLAIYLFHNLLVVSLGIPFLLPSLPGLLLVVGGGLGAALVTVTLAALIPAYRISRQEPALAMRE